MSDKFPQPRKNISPWKFILGFWGFSIMAAIVGAFLCFLINDLQNLLFSQLGMAESFIGVKIPQNATHIHREYGGFQDHYAHIRFDLPSAEFETWFAQYVDQCPQGLERNFNPFRYNDDDWWTPMNAQVYVGQDCQLLNEEINRYYTTFEILVDKTNPDIWTVYLSS